ncbi:MAG: DUF3293 domain-containing protein [Pyrinomonadaceae bacterium]|nr:DUF3293 domain-containing protein [Pyrinomonadaceae bacterium]
MTDLAEMYRLAVYVVEDGDTRFVIRLGQENRGLDAHLAGRSVSCWAFLTAYNPNSTPTPEKLNLEAQARLAERLTRCGYTFLRGYGTSESGDWPPEASFFVEGIPRTVALEIGRDFGQSAILWGRSGGSAELLWCD